MRPPWHLAFPNPAEERDYRTFCTRRYRDSPRWITGVAIAAFGSFAYFDTLSTAATTLLLARFLLVVPLLAGILAISTTKWGRERWVLCIDATTQVSHAAIVGLMWLYEGTSTYNGLSTAAYPLNLALLMAIVGSTTPIPVAHVAAHCVLAFATYVLIGATVGVFANGEFMLYAFNVAAVAVAMTFAAWWRERLLRALFREESALIIERNTLSIVLSEIVPTEVAMSIKQGHKVPPQPFGEVAILFADIVGFTRLSARMGPGHLVEVLDRLFSRFDAIAESRGVEKVKTIGDSYMVVGGGRLGGADCAHSIVDLGHTLIGEARAMGASMGIPLEMRVGVHLGSVIGGVIGRTRMAFDYWGEAVNLASRLESSGTPGRIHVSEQVWLRVRDRYRAETERTIELKGIGAVLTYVLEPQSAPDDTPAMRADE